MKQKPLMLDDKAIPVLTKGGERELHEPGTTLSPSQLEALVLIDGYSTVAQVVKRAGKLSPDILRTSLNELIGKGFVTVNADPAYNAIDPGDFFTLEAAHTAAAEEGEHAHPEIDADAEFLRRNGYYVNMARRPAVKLNRADGRKLTVLVIEDDPDICKVLRICLSLEGFETRMAAKRDEVIVELRRLPPPDLVLLDVRLPDVNGFDILTKMRQHHALKGLPVIMLTAEASRGAVLKGIQCGADGFVTKPFQIHPLVRTVKTVLGMQHDPKD